MTSTDDKAGELDITMTTGTTGTVRAVLFDIDGTLFDTQATMLASARTALAGSALAAGAAVDLDAGARVWALDRGGRYDEFMSGRIDFVEQRRRRVVDLYAEVGLAPPDPDEVESWLRRYAEAQLRLLTTYDDVLDCLRACAGLRVAALSNNDGRWQRERMDHAGLSRWFVSVSGIEDVGVAKPDPAAFLAACRALDVAPADVVYVGDDLDIDARGATAAGLRGVWLDRHPLGHPHGAGGEGAVAVDVPRITSLAALPALFGGWTQAG